MTKNTAACRHMLGIISIATGFAVSVKRSALQLEGSLLSEAFIANKMILPKVGVKLRNGLASIHFRDEQFSMCHYSLQGNSDMKEICLLFIGAKQ